MYAKGIRVQLSAAVVGGPDGLGIFVVSFGDREDAFLDGHPAVSRLVAVDAVPLGNVVNLILNSQGLGPQVKKPNLEA